MVRILSIVLAILMLCGCSRSNEQMEEAMNLRDSIINSNGCSFDVTITADYQDMYYTFAMFCKSDAIGNVAFEVTAPDSISGITGIVSAEDGKLTFDDQVLLFSTLAEGQITPVSAPWLFLNSLKSGYIKGCGTDNGTTLLQIDDSYANNSMQQNIHIAEGAPFFVEIFWSGRRVVTLDVKRFNIL